LPDGVLAATSLDQALVLAGQVADLDRVFLVGGGELYKIGFAHPRCAGIYFTRIEFDFACDTHIPAFEDAFERDPAWPVATHADHGFTYEIEHWRRAPT
jgi:dihydrofolate reductase